MNGIMNMIEKYKLINRMPKDKRSDLKMIMDRANFYEVSDTGNEQYVLNVIEQDHIIDRVNTEGHLYLMCATSRFEMKMLRYEMRFGDKNEVIILKSTDDNLTDAEEMAWDRYITEFCTAIKNQLQYQVEYSVKYVESKQEQNEVVKNTIEVNNVTQSESTINVHNTVKVDERIECNPLELVRKAVEGKTGETLVLTAYARNGKFGVGVDIGTNTVANLIIEDRENLEEEDVIRATTAIITLSQSIGVYMKLKRVKDEVAYYFYQDRDVYIEVPQPFVVISKEDLQVSSN